MLLLQLPATMMRMSKRIASFETKNAEETIQLGIRLASDIPVNSVIGLSGEMGTGKTVLTKGLVSGLGAGRESDVDSPTFKIINIYSGSFKIYHIDLYRLSSIGEIMETGLFDLLNDNNIVIIEWAEKLEPLQMKFSHYINLTYLSEQQRSIKVKYLA
jgi:tRNA threonylcarbamoyladenosine biosynthesis protein TsaE